MLPFFIVSGLAVIASGGGILRFLIQAGFVVPLMTMFFGCGVWVVWNLGTHMGHLDLESFGTSALIGLIPALMVASKF